MVREQNTRGGYRQPGFARRSKGPSKTRGPRTFEPSWLKRSRAMQPRPMQLSKSVMHYLQQLVNQGFGVERGPSNTRPAGTPVYNDYTTKHSGRPAWQPARTAHGRPVDDKLLAQQPYKAFPGKENTTGPFRRTQQRQKQRGAQQRRGVRKNRRGGRRGGSGRTRQLTINPPPAPHNTNSYLMEVHRPAGGYDYEAALEAAIRQASIAQPRPQESSGRMGSSGCSLGLDHDDQTADHSSSSSSSDDCRYGNGVLRINPPAAPHNDNAYLLAVHRPAGGWGYEQSLERTLQANAAAVAAAAAGAAHDDGNDVSDDEIEDLERILGQFHFGGAAAAAAEEVALVGPATPAQERE